MTVVEQRRYSSSQSLASVIMLRVASQVDSAPTPLSSNVSVSSVKPASTSRPLPSYMQRLSIEATRYAASGRVCMGPAGTPVSINDVKLFGMLAEEKPHEVGTWFLEAFRTGFFDEELEVPQDCESQPMYVVYRGTGDGPGVYLRWEEVIPITLGLQGTMYQRCASPAQVASRLLRALTIDGLVMRLQDSLRGVTGNGDVWLRALAPSPYPPLRMSLGLLPLNKPRPSASTLQVSTSALQPDLSLAVNHHSLVDVSPLPLPADVNPCSHPLAAVDVNPGPLAHEVLSPAPAAAHAALPSFLHPSRTVTMSAFGDRPGLAPTPRPSDSDTSTSDTADSEGFYVVCSGRVPWLYYTA
ncbi:hypothetical protein OH77DRAFT_1431120 [Trametes cingulata]|nr:hypothetical protein OH77DRAFT_1431120 [Trametes cingulata]